MDRILSRQSAQHISQVALFAALLAVLGLIPKIDLPFGVPITAQTLGIMLAGCLLGPWRGFQAVLLFVVAAALGLPVLSGGRGGLAPFMSPSAGYLYGFAPAAFTRPHGRTDGCQRLHRLHGWRARVPAPHGHHRPDHLRRHDL